MEPARKVHTGGCACGAVRFEVLGRRMVVADCHCRMCQRAVGAAFVTWASIRAERLRILRGGALELSPTPGHPARQVIRELRISLEPASGEVTELVLVEASGDVVTLTLSEHRR